MPDYYRDAKYSDLRQEWEHAEYYLRFRAQDRKWAYHHFGQRLTQEVVPNRTAGIVWEYAVTLYRDLMFVDPTDADLADVKRNVCDAAAKGRSVKAGMQELPKFAVTCVASLVPDRWASAPCLSGVQRADLEACMQIWQGVARGTSVTHSAGYGQGAAASGAPPGDRTISLSSSDTVNGRFATLFTLGHEFGHKADLAIRASYPGVIKAIYPDFTMPDDTQPQWGQQKALQSLEYFADGFSALWMRWALRLRAQEVRDGAEQCLENTPEDYSHPCGDDRLSEIRKRLA